MRSAPKFSRFARGILWSATLIAYPGFALSRRTVDIFDKRNRVLREPSEDLRSNQADWEYRLSAETQRLRRAPVGGAARVPASGEPFASADIGVGSAGAGAATGAGAAGERGGSDRSANRARGETAEPEPAARRSDLRSNSAGNSSRSRRGGNSRSLVSVGFVGGGSYGVFGAELGFAVSPELTVGAGLGTGMSYDVWGLHARYLLNRDENFNVFVQGGYAHWRLEGVARSGTAAAPAYLTERFFGAEGTARRGQEAHLVYPALGVLFRGNTGVAVAASAQYLMSMNNYTGGLAASLGLYLSY